MECHPPTCDLKKLVAWRNVFRYRPKVELTWTALRRKRTVYRATASLSTLPLNQNLEWKQISANPDIRAAFRGTPSKTLLPAGQMLCRFITTESRKTRVPGTNTFLSPWWMDWSMTASELARWKTAKAKPKDIIRARLAVTTDFSQQLDSLVQIILTQSVYAWKGLARHQDDKLRRVTYLGGGEQLFLPNLASDPLGMSSGVAYMHCFTAIESLV